MNKLSNNLLIKYSKKNSTSGVQYSIDQILNYIEINNITFYNKKDYQQNDKELFKYDRFSNKINIPNNFTKLPQNKKIFDEAKQNYSNNSLEVIISHELGHQTQHQFLKRQESLGNWDVAKNGDICLTKFEGYNQKIVEAQDFFRADNNTPNGINRFIQQNFMESYADCYSGLVTYLKNDSKDVFSNIETLREKTKRAIKTNNSLSINNGQILNGNFSTSEYFNFYGIRKFGDNFVNIFEKEYILDVTKNNFETIHHLIQTEVLDGLYVTIKEEAKTNNLFLLELKDFCATRHNCSISTFFDKFEYHLNNLRKIYCKYDSTNTLDNGAPYFDFDNKCLSISHEHIINEYRRKLKTEDLIDFDKENFSKLLLNQFSENYAIQQSNYNLTTINTNLDNISNIKHNIFHLREQFLEQNPQKQTATLKQ